MSIIKHTSAYVITVERGGRKHSNEHYNEIKRGFRILKACQKRMGKSWRYSRISSIVNVCMGFLQTKVMWERGRTTKAAALAGTTRM